MNKWLTIALAGLAAAVVIGTLALYQSTGKPTSKLPNDLVIEAPATPPNGMVWIPGGRFTMGTPFRPAPGAENPLRVKPDEYPAHDVIVDGFYLDAHEVTNAEFKAFVDATGYITYSERVPTDQDLINLGLDPNNVPDAARQPASICFNPNYDRANLRTDFPGWEYQVWMLLPGASWKHPEGPESSIEDRMDHPVVHVAFEDVLAYCEWAGKRLPTEAEFEYAMRGGHEGRDYPWGDELLPDGKYMCNYYQGTFPVKNLNEDGFPGTAPVGSFPSNDYGLYDVSGNVWEWVADLYHHDYYAESPVRNPPGPKTSFDPGEPNMIKRVTRGGSFMCNTNNCTGYRCAARMRSEQYSGAFHTGFRCAVSASDVANVRSQKSSD